MMSRLKRARRLAQPSPAAQRAGRRRPSIPCPAEVETGPVREALEIGRNRLIVAGAVLTLGFVVVAFRLIDITLLQAATEPRIAQASKASTIQLSRADIVDRNGVLLATSLPTASLYANPRQIPDADETARRLAGALPELDAKRLVRRLKRDRAFVWIKRKLTPNQRKRVLELGLPGVDFRREEARVYPQGRLMSHMLGYVDVDETGIAGVERRFDVDLRERQSPLELSIDVRYQHILCRELAQARDDFSAIGAAGLILDVRTSEVRAMCSLPDFDPNRIGETPKSARFNRAALGVYELGSAFKIFTTAMALDVGVAGLDKKFDATKPLKISRFTIRDFHAKRRWLSVSEIFMYSSNIGAARLAMEVGGTRQRDFLDRLGLLKPAAIELPEVGSPMSPRVWRPINTMTIGFGHGIAVSPLQLTAGVAAMVNGGTFRQPTLLRRDPEASGRRVISERTSKRMRRLMRLVVERGTGGKADAVGYLVGGKTGTAEKSGVGGYARQALLSSFVGAFPIDLPCYVIFVMLDEPKGIKASAGYATGGWVAAPAVGRIVKGIAPIAGIRPEPIEVPSVRRDFAMDRPSEPDRLATF